MAIADSIRVSLFQRGGTGEYIMQYREPITGNKRRRKTGTSKLREAERLAAKWEEELHAQQGRPDGRTAFETFRLRYEDEVLSGLKATTDKKASGVLRVYQRVMRPDVLADITTEAIAKYQTKLRRLPRSPNTIKGHMAHLRSALA